jgi:hypothetical protein
MQLGLTMAKSLINKLVEKPKKSEENLINSQELLTRLKKDMPYKERHPLRKEIVLLHQH